MSDLFKVLNGGHKASNISQNIVVINTEKANADI